MKIFETKSNNKRKQFDDFWAHEIVPNCSQILKAYTKTVIPGQTKKGFIPQERLLYRGMSRQENWLFKGHSPSLRVPKDTAKLVHAQINRILAANGFEARRDNSLFTTTDYSFAAGYGQTVFIIFPVNGFHFTWSKAYKDWYNSLFEGIKNINALAYPQDYFNKPYAALEVYRVKETRRFGGKYWQNPGYHLILDAQTELRRIGAGIKKANKAFANDLTNYANFHKDNKTIAKKMNEIIAYVNAAPSMKASSKVEPKVMKEILNKLELDNSHLVSALRSTNEVLINGYYYGIEYDPYRLNVHWIMDKIAEYKMGKQ